MSAVELVIEERQTNIGNFPVGRLLPFRKKRMLGPFIFIDHIGPIELSTSQNLDVDMHPHIGLATLTYLFEGVIAHRDSLGTVTEIEPGAVNWMVAGKGVVHTERTPARLRQTTKSLHGLQIWVALPQSEEQCEPSFTHIPTTDIPSWQDNQLTFRLITGALFARQSPVPIPSPGYFIEIKSSQSQELNLGNDLFGECGIYILQGSLELESQTYHASQLIVMAEISKTIFTLNANSILYIFGGTPFAEPRYIDWNFVATDKALIEQAKSN